MTPSLKMAFKIQQETGETVLAKMWLEKNDQLLQRVLAKLEDDE